jgi:cytoskeletal protein CcmA (bactofilin family)
MWNREAPSHDERGRQPQTGAPGTPPRQEERRLVAWVGKSVIFKGDLISSEDMTIDGRVEGTIEVRDHRLTIGPDADIRADIVAKTVIVCGKLTGTITAHYKVDIRETGRVDGDILSPRLAMADGAVLRGRVDTASREDARNNRGVQLTTA